MPILKGYYSHYTLDCVLTAGDDVTTDSIRGAVSSPFGNNIGDLTSIDHGSSSCVPLCCTRLAPSGNLTDFLDPLRFGERISGITDGEAPAKNIFHENCNNSTKI